MKKIILTGFIFTIAIGLGSTPVMAGLPKGCHYHSDGRIHCTFTPAGIKSNGDNNMFNLK